MKRSIFVASALITLILVFTACGAETTATPPPTKDISQTQEIPLTTVIVMAKANKIREIQVDGKKLTVYPKTNASGGPDRFVSRIGSTDIIALLIDSGVEVGPPSGVEVTFKGVSAEDVQATITAVLANQEGVKKVLVTPTSSAAAEARVSIDGLWEGATLYRSRNLITLVNFATGKEGLKGTLDFPEIGREGLVLSNVSFEPPRVHFELTEFGTVFDGELQGDTISGVFADPDGSGNFSLIRR